MILEFEVNEHPLSTLPEGTGRHWSHIMCNTKTPALIRTVAVGTSPTFPGSLSSPPFCVSVANENVRFL